MKFKQVYRALGTAVRRSGLGVSGFALMAFAATASQAQEELNALVWCDHTDPQLIEP